MNMGGHMNSGRAIFCGLVSLLLTGVPASAATPAISWEVENGFRYFKRASDFRALARIYSEEKTRYPNPTALQIEQALENAVLDPSGRFNNIGGNERRLGWAASIYTETCGKQADHTHASCEMENKEPYLEPKTTNVILRVDGIPSGPCEWSIDGVALETVNCNEGDSGGGKPLVARVAYDVPHSVQVKPAGGEVLTTTIVVRDILIASFGDSFSSGEGNPERPATFSNDYSDYGRSSRQGLPGRVDYFPVRAPGSQFFGVEAANWTNTQCHRSLYSQHTKAALQYALEHPHISVTFLNYSCTGAEVYQGILNAWWGRDVSQHDWDDAPQIVKALRDLCKDPGKYLETEWSNGDRLHANFNSRAAVIPKCSSFRDRKIDALLLSVGGNDVGFASMIAYSAIDVRNAGPARPGVPWAYGLWRNVEQPQTFRQGEIKAQALLPGLYQALAAGLKDHLEFSAPEKLVLSAYPDVNTDEKGEICGQHNVGMDVHAIFGMANPGASEQSASFVKFLHNTMKREAGRQGWHLADQHIADDNAPNNFRGHGLCASGPTNLVRAKMQFPRPELGRPPPFVWNPFYPETWTPYSERTRWLVTPNDAFLTGNYLDPKLNADDPVQPLYAATLSGAFHPNALGYAALADSVLVELRQVLAAFEDK
jgi:hypothetical protein